MNEQELRFQHWSHHPGPNTTIRRGTKWLEALHGGDRILLVSLDHACQGCIRYARVVSVRATRFATVLALDIVGHHDPSCTSRDGLLLRMREWYPDFDADEIVTVICYEIED